MHTALLSDGACVGHICVKSQVIHLTSLQTRAETDHALCAQLVAQHEVPADLRFNLLTRVRAARAFGTLDGRRQITAWRLLALTVLLQSNPDPGMRTPPARLQPPLLQQHPSRKVNFFRRARVFLPSTSVCVESPESMRFPSIPCA